MEQRSNRVQTTAVTTSSSPSLVQPSVLPQTTTTKPLTQDSPVHLQDKTPTPFEYQCSDQVVGDFIHIGIVTTDSHRQKATSLPLLALMKSILANRHLPLHFHFLSRSSTTNDTISKLLSTWNIPHIEWTVYSTAQTEPIPSIVHGSILLNLLLPPIIKEFIVLSSDALVIRDIGRLWKYLQTHKSASRIVTENDFKSVVLLTNRFSKSQTMINKKDFINEFSETVPFIVPCSSQQEVSCESHILKQQLQVDDSLSYNNTRSSLKFDANVEENVYLKCDHHISYDKMEKMDAKSRRRYCTDLTKIGQNRFRSLLYLFGQRYSSDDNNDVTLVTQLTFSRVSRLPLFLSHWSGPASIAIYSTDEEVEELYKFLNSSADISERARQRKDLSIHVVFNHSLIYPINYIRNIALEAVTTPYVIVNDFDFLINYDSYPKIKKAISVHTLNNGRKTGLVIPAFETTKGGIVSFPKSKQELLSLVDSKEVFQFHLNKSARLHLPTNYSKWRNTIEPYTVHYCMAYEPYIVINRKYVQYDTRFVGFGWNKVSQVMELHAQSFEFVVLPDLFLLHIWHPSSLQRKKYLTKPFQRCLRKQQRSFLHYLKSKYGGFHVECGTYSFDLLS